jgi:hypothetical protein
MLGQTGEDVEDRRFAYVGLAGQGDQQACPFRRRTLVACQGIRPEDEDFIGLTAPQGDPRVPGLGNEEPPPAAQDFDLHVEGHAQTGQAARQFAPSCQGLDDAFLPLLKLGQGDQFIVYRHAKRLQTILG